MGRREEDEKRERRIGEGIVERIEETPPK